MSTAHRNPWETHKPGERQRLGWMRAARSSPRSIPIKCPERERRSHHVHQFLRAPQAPVWRAPPRVCRVVILRDASHHPYKCPGGKVWSPVPPGILPRARTANAMNLAGCRRRREIHLPGRSARTAQRSSRGSGSARGDGGCTPGSAVLGRSREGRRWWSFYFVERANNTVIGDGENLRKRRGGVRTFPAFTTTPGGAARSLRSPGRGVRGSRRGGVTLR